MAVVREQGRAVEVGILSKAVSVMLNQILCFFRGNSLIIFGTYEVSAKDCCANCSMTRERQRASILLLPPMSKNR